MTNEKYEQHFYGAVQGIVIGDNNTVILNYQGSQQRTVLFLAPPRPSYNIVGRENLLNDLKQQLFNGKSLALSALSGLPGVGKTALAIELAYDREVLNHFGDGILWIGLGRDLGHDGQDILSLLGKWGRPLGIPSEQMAILTNAKEWAETIHNTIGMKRMLLVIDDAWDIRTALSFKLGGPNCAHLLTTRKPEVAILFAGEATTVGELSNADGLTLLDQFIPKIVKTKPDEIQELERAVGSLPLALILMGKYLQIEESSGQPRRLQAAIERLRSIKERLQINDAQGLVGSHPSLPVQAEISLEAIINISSEALDEEIRRAFFTLSAFPPKPNTFSEEAACLVSQAPIDTLDTLYDYGLLERSGVGRYTLHQAIEEFAKINLTEYTPYERMGDFYTNMLAPYKDLYVSFDKNSLSRIELEEGNIKASLVWYQEQDMWQKFIPLALGFCSYLGYISRWQEEIEWGKKVSNAAYKIGDNLAIAHIYCHVLPWPMWMRGEYEQARETCQAGIVAAQKLNDIYQPIYLSLAHHNLHRTALQECQNTNDRALITSCLKEINLHGEQCLEFSKQTKGNSLFETLQGLAFSDIGYTALKVGDYQEAELWFRQRLALVKETNNPNPIQIASRLLDVSLAVIGQKRFVDAKNLLDEARMIAEGWKRGDLNAELLFGLARIENELGNVTLAQELEGQARQFWKEVGFTREPFVYILNKPESMKFDE